MSFDDGKKVYSVNDIQKLLDVDVAELSATERQYLNSFSRYMYDRYRAIRDCCNPKKCKKISILQVRERLEQENYKALTTRLLKFNSEQINYILNYVSIYFRNFI